MRFDEILPLVRDGEKRFTRKRWNGNREDEIRMWVVVMTPLFLPPFNTQDTMRKVNDRTAKHIGEDTSLDSQPYFALFTPDKKWQPGWLPSQADIFADDYILMD